MNILAFEISQLLDRIDIELEFRNLENRINNLLSGIEEKINEIDETLTNTSVTNEVVSEVGDDGAIASVPCEVGGDGGDNPREVGDDGVIASVPRRDDGVIAPR